MNKFLLKLTSVPKRKIDVKNFSTSVGHDILVKIDDNYPDKFMTRIFMNNEKQRNALSLDMIAALHEAVDSIDLSKCRVLVVDSSSPKIFSSGHNLKELTKEFGSSYHEKVFSLSTKLCLKLRDLPIPTIAQVHGLAAAAGFQLAASCDIIVASNKSSFSTPGVKFGLFCSTPGVALARNVNSKLALKMLFTGEPISAHEALVSGLLSEIVNIDTNPDALTKRVNEIAMSIRNNSKPVIELGKKCFYEQVKQTSLEEAYKVATCTMVDNLKYADTQSGLDAFKAKQKPKWTNSYVKTD